MREKNVQTTQPAPTASAVRPCPTISQIGRTPRPLKVYPAPRLWKFTLHHRSTRPPLCWVNFQWPRTPPALEVYQAPSLHPTIPMLGKFSVAGGSYNFDDGRARAYCACSRCRWFGHFYILVGWLVVLGLTAL